MRFVGDKYVERMTGISVKTLRNWRCLGKGPRYKKLGRSARYEISALEAWIRSCPAGGGGRTERIAATTARATNATARATNATARATNATARATNATARATNATARATNATEAASD
jgi:predicted DNA-binding transcriptional regulator AlpA